MPQAFIESTGDMDPGLFLRYLTLRPRLRSRERWPPDRLGPFREAAMHDLRA